MTPTEADMKDLLSQPPHSGMIEAVEAYLDAQVSGSAPYSSEATRLLIKLYHIFPNTLNKDKVGQAFMLAMADYPKPDVLALSYMIPLTVLHAEPCSLIQTCTNLLEACQFEKFWNEYDNLKSYAGDEQIQQIANASVDKLQKSILGVLALTYKEAPLGFVKKAIKSDETDVIEKADCVEKVGPDAVTFKSTVDNTKRQHVYQERINFSSISALMGKMSQ
jgi:hypothetical protein